MQVSLSFRAAHAFLRYDKRSGRLRRLLLSRRGLSTSEIQKFRRDFAVSNPVSYNCILFVSVLTLYPGFKNLEQVGGRNNLLNFEARRPKQVAEFFFRAFSSAKQHVHV